MTSSAATSDQITLDANALVKGCGCAYCQNDQGSHDHFQDGSENPIFEAAVLNGGGGEYTPASVGQNNADELIHGYEWGPGGGTGVSLTYSFPTSIPSYYSPYAPEQNNFSAFTTEMQNAVRSVMSHIETFIDVSFTEVSGTGDITFAQARLPNDNTLAYAYYPDQANYSGDVWFNNLYNFSPAMDAGEVGYFIAMHEIGHALGLIHSFEAGLTGAEDSEQYTVLSYDTSPWGSTLSAETYMLYDIAALQSIYGANTTYNTGNDIYFLDPNAAYTVWDAGGTDTFNSSAVSSDVIIRLEEGGFSSVGLDQNIAIAYGTIIENATTGAGDDIIYANAAANIINGGAGSDTVNYSLGDAVSIDLLYGSASNGLAQGDTLTSIENIIGSDSSDSTQRDWLWGDAQNNHFEGLSGNDILEGGAGADIIDGGAGWDYARYTRSSAGVTINLETGVHTGGDAQGDTLIDIEAIVGSAHDDTLIGGASNDYLRGENGDDVLRGGAGSDQMIGGAGNDTYTFDEGRDRIIETGADTDRVVFSAVWSPEDLTISGNEFIFTPNIDTIIFNDISLIEFFAFDGFADMSLTELEDYLDSLTDTETGTAGDDTFIATNAAEEFDGLGGSDTVDYSASSDAVIIDLLNNTATGGDAQGDSFTSIENIIGSDDSALRDTIYGDAAVNIIDGKDGADILEGGAGADVINGGAGWDYSRYTRSSAGVNINLETGVNTGGDAQGDTLINIEAVVGSNHNDTLIGGASNDFFRGENGDDILDGGDGRDQLYGGSGADTFIFHAITAFNDIDLLRDFKITDGDILDLSDVLQGYDAVSDAITDFVQITESGGNTIVSVDADGGADAFLHIATITGLHRMTDEEGLETSGNLITV